MNAFVNSINNVEENKTFTTNGMPTFKTSENSLLDLFYVIGAARKKDISAVFQKALEQDKKTALQILLWARDVREGAGERQTFRNLFNFYIQNYNSGRDILIQTRIIDRLSELGRWDDLLAISGSVREYAIDIYKNAILNGNGLAAKWAPRKGPVAVELTQAFGWSPKRYRKTIVNLTKVVEQQMCAKNWSEIDYSKVPSVASSRYMKAFYKNDQARYSEWRDALKTGVDKSGNAVKINASVVYPYDVIRALKSGGESAVADAQWAALPNYTNDRNVLCVVDVSGSMKTPVSGSVTALDVALSLGLYTSDKSSGAFKDVFMTFSESPQLQRVSGTLSEKMKQMNSSRWGMNTDFLKAMNEILNHALGNNVPEEDMPQTLLIVSDMQFDGCVRNSSLTSHQEMRKKYAEAGYNMPNVIFWNVNSPLGQSPVKFNAQGVGIVSGFSPTILKSILGGDINPMKIMLQTVDKERYTVV